MAVNCVKCGNMSRLLRAGQLARLTRGPSTVLSRRTTPRTTVPLSRLPSVYANAPIQCRARHLSTGGPEPPKDDKGNRKKKKRNGDARNAAGKSNNKAEGDRRYDIDPAVLAELPPAVRDTLKTYEKLSEGDIERLKKVIDEFPRLQGLGLPLPMEIMIKYGAPPPITKLLSSGPTSFRDMNLRELNEAFNDMGGCYTHIAKAEQTVAERQKKNMEKDEEKKPDNKEQSFWKKVEQESNEEEPEEEGGEQKSKKDKSKSGGFKLGPLTISDIIILGLMMGLTQASLGSIFGSTREITWQEVRRLFLDKGLVEGFVVQEGRVDVILNKDAASSVYDGNSSIDPSMQYYFTIGSVKVFEKHLDDAQSDLGIPPSERIPVKYGGKSPWLSILLGFGPTLLLIGLLVYSTKQIGSRAGNQMFGFGKSKAKKFNHETAIKVKFSDVAGMDEAKVEIMEFVSFLKTPEKFRKLGAKIPRGAILAGPPGTGKTLLAKATAGECQVPFFSVSGSEFVEMFVGVGPSRVRDLFSTARNNAPCIIFIDEIDAIGRARLDSKMGGGGNDERESTLNQILTEMDGFNTTDQVVVLAGTNRADILDKALMRPGRFDRHIFIDRPTQKGREAIFRVHLSKIVTNENIDHLVGRLGTLTPGFSGADIAHVVNEAALIAARVSADSVLISHFEQAIERTIGGLERKSLILRPEEKRTVAYHEAGHAICGWFLKDADPLLKVSIIPRGQSALGYAQYLPQDAYLMSTKQLMDRMAMTLGGRISEELHFDTVTTGASDDFKKVTQLAMAMVTQWGMSDKVGPLHYEDDSRQRVQKPFAEETGRTIDAEVRRIVDEAYTRAKDLLTEKKKEVGLIAEELLQKEMLTRDDLVRVLGPRPFGDNHRDFEKYFGGQGKEAPPFPPAETDTPPSPPFGRHPDGR